MTAYFEHLLRDLGDNWLVYSSMPLIAALIGYSTKLVAVQMLLRPLEFRGIRPILGWQGIIPRYAARMATTAMDLMLDKLITPQELVERMDANQLTKHIQEPLVRIIDELTRELLAKYYPTFWEVLPEAGRRLFIRRVQADAPKVIAGMLTDMRENIDEVLDLKSMGVDALVRDKVLLVRLVEDIARPELRFMVRSGLVFGFLLGIAQALIWAVAHQEWLMPAFGFFVGYLTDWLALNMIFRPIRRKRFFGVFPWQGLFHRRRDEVARDYADLIASEILSPRNVTEALLNGPQSDRLFWLIQREVQSSLDGGLGFAKPLVVLTLGGRRFQEMKQDAVRIVLERFPQAAHDIEGAAMESIDPRSLVVEKMGHMTPEEYEALLRPAFKQDEWKLILIGGVLGGFIGELQVLLLLH